MTCSEKEFNAVAYAAQTMLKRGETSIAYTLDDLARKINRDLSVRSRVKEMSLYRATPVKLYVESPLESLGLRPKKKK